MHALLLLKPMNWRKKWVRTDASMQTADQIETDDWIIFLTCTMALKKDASRIVEGMVKEGI